MTLDGFAGAERIAATLDVLAEALLDEQATHYPLDALTAFRRDAHPSAEALFGLRLGTGGGPGVLTVRGLGTVVEGGTTRRTESAAGAEQALTARYGAGAVRGVPVGPDTPSGGGSAAERFRLPVVPEPGDAEIRPPFTAALAALASARPTLEPEELSTGSGVEARLVVPSVFHPLTARGGGAAVAEHLAEVAEEMFAGGGSAVRRDWSVLAASLADEATAAGVVFAGLSALRSGDRTSHASLVVSLAPAQGPADELAHRLADARPHAEVWTVLLPAGPAALLVEPRALAVPGHLAADGQARRAVSSVVQAVLPLPDGSTALTLQLGTVQADDWELYASVFAEVLQSVQLGWDGVIATPAPVPAPVSAPVAVPAPAAAPPQAPAPVQAAVAEPAEAAPAAPAADVWIPAPAAPAPVAPPVVPTPPAAPAPAPVPTAATTAPEGPKGTPVRIPPPDFNPFAPPAPSTPTAPVAAVPAPAAPADGQAPGAGKGTPVRVPPPDFDPFAPPAPSAGAPAAPAAPAPVAAVPAPAAPAVADPFGTVVSNEPQDPFGTVTGAPPARPAAPVSAPPPPAAAPAAPAAEAPAGPGKGTPVRIPPPDFNPFAPPAPTTPAAAAPTEEAPAGPGKGTPVRIPPPDFNPFAPPAPTTGAPAAPAAPAPAAEEPPAYNPFG